MEKEEIKISLNNVVRDVKLERDELKNSLLKEQENKTSSEEALEAEKGLKDSLKKEKEELNSMLSRLQDEKAFENGK